MQRTRSMLTDLLPRRKPLRRRPLDSLQKRRPDLQPRRRRRPRNQSQLRNQSKRRRLLPPSPTQTRTRSLLTSRNCKMSLQRPRKTLRGQRTSSPSSRLPSKSRPLRTGSLRKRSTRAPQLAPRTPLASANSRDSSRQSPRSTTCRSK